MSPPVAERRGDRGAFFGAWLREPLKMGAIVPSSASLADLMVAGLEQGSRVIELGGGTGAITRAILSAGVQPKDLFVFERHARLTQHLERQYPGVNVFAADALSLHRYAEQFAGAIDFVISGLPALCLRKVDKARLFCRIFSVLGDRGSYRQFTYAPRSPINGALMDRLNLKESLIGFTPINLPPAFVYQFKTNGS